MSKEYKDVMNKITMDKDMQKRILLNLENITEEIDFKEKSNNFKFKILSHRFKKNIRMCAACCMVIICYIANQPLINILKFKDTNSQSLEISQDNHLKDIDSDTHLEKSYTDSSLQGNDSDSTEEIKHTTDTISKDSKIGSLPSKKEHENSKIQKSYSKTAENKVNSSPKSMQSQDMTPNVQTNNSKPNSSGNNEISTSIEKNDDSNLTKKSMNIDKAPMDTNTSIEDFDNLSDLKKSVNFEFKIPQILPEGFKLKNAKFISQQVISITYTNSNDMIEFTTAKTNTDISSHLKNYTTEKTIKLNIGDITLKGNNESTNLLTWIQDDMSYCISAPNGLGEDEALNMVRSISVYK